MKSKNFSESNTNQRDLELRTQAYDTRPPIGSLFRTRNYRDSEPVLDAEYMVHGENFINWIIR